MKIYYVLKVFLEKIIGRKLYIKASVLVNGYTVYWKAFDNHKCIFIHVPKTAGTSVGEAIFGNGRTGHFGWEIYRACSKKKFDDYFKFAFVRNPYDRVVSSFYYLSQGGKSEADKKFFEEYLSGAKDFEDFVMNYLGSPVVMSWGHFRPQADYLVDYSSGKVMVDWLGRLESINEDFAFLREKFNCLDIEVKNKSQRNDFRTYYSENPAIAEKIHEIYAKDFEYFGYEKNSFGC
ncbi:MAG: hypothetical protein CL537_02480 [Alcanivoracaceae bacterium]|nr:hypothetical protein [Alcanivoracaceae bacterium]|tara:strand:- start:819 stop:1520 length:702 start_codon:yes stop_codon:yes gene_type:complete